MIRLMSSPIRKKGRVTGFKDVDVHKGSSHLQGNVSVTNLIQTEIAKKMCPSNSVTKRFICESRLREEVWHNIPLYKIPVFEHWDSAGLEIVKEDYLIVLSILIYIGWKLDRFRPVIYKKGINDKGLPFKEGQLSELDGVQQPFIDVQFMFIPQYIRWYHSSYINEIGKDFCLPFTKEPEPQGAGSSGVVTKQIIAAGYFLETEDSGRTVKNLQVCSLQKL